MKRKLTVEYEVIGKGSSADFKLYNDEGKLLEEDTIDLTKLRDRLWAIGFHAQAIINANIYDDFNEGHYVRYKDKRERDRKPKDRRKG